MIAGDYDNIKRKRRNGFMSIRMVGIDHGRAPVDVRAWFSFTKKGAAAGMQRLMQKEGINGVIILSTCNRMELWASVDETWDGSLLEELCLLKELDPTEFAEYFTVREEQEAAEHLFYLACGLKSRILAEDQIITQIKDALSWSREHFCTDNVLEVLFRKAVTAAKKVKTQVVFSHANTTAMDSAVAMLHERGFSLKGRRCMVIGNGEMGRLAALTLMKAGADVTVTVRQYRSGMVAIPLGCSRINYGDRMEYLPSCDLVVSATASPNYTLRKEDFENIHLEHPMILIDLAVPRDIDPNIRGLEGIDMYNIDDFRLTGMEGQEDALKGAACILQEELEEFFSWYSGRNLIPRIQEIQRDAAQDLELRLSKIIRKLPLETDEQEKLRQNIRTAAQKVVNKMMFGLKDALDQEVFLECVEGLEKLYEE